MRRGKEDPVRKRLLSSSVGTMLGIAGGLLLWMVMAATIWWLLS